MTARNNQLTLVPASSGSLIPGLGTSVSLGTSLPSEITAFLVDRSARGCSPRTLQFYRDELKWFAQALGDVDPQSITPQQVREFLRDLGTHRNKGGVHANYRAIKAFFNWYKSEYEPTDWRNPIDRVNLESQARVPLPGVPLDHVRKMVETCGKGYYGLRDRAILWFLVDSGVRMAELVALRMGDVDLGTGAVEVRHGKGDKPRTTFVGATVRRELTRYLRTRGPQTWDPEAPLFSTQDGKPLTRSGLREVIRRRAKAAGLEEPGLHDFRRTFALESLRNGCDVFSLMRLMGHTSPTVLQRYLALVKDDIQKAHRASSPVDVGLGRR